MYAVSNSQVWGTPHGPTHIPWVPLGLPVLQGCIFQPGPLLYLFGNWKKGDGGPRVGAVLLFTCTAGKPSRHPPTLAQSPARQVRRGSAGIFPNLTGTCHIRNEMGCLHLRVDAFGLYFISPLSPWESEASPGALEA